MRLPKLPAKAAYLLLDNASKRNALSVEVLKSLRQQLIQYNTPRGETKPLLLPPPNPILLKEIPKSCNKKATGKSDDYRWLVDADEWQRRRGGLPKVLVLRSEGPVFSAGHDLKEIDQMDAAGVEETFALCVDLMSLLCRSPIPVVGVIQGLATAAGAQLALTTDLPVACASAQFQLPGMSIGLPCTSPSTALSRKLGNAFTYRMFALAEPVRADQLPAGAVETVLDEAALEARVAEIIEKLVSRYSAQAQAMGKWAYWTQASLDRPSRSSPYDSYPTAAKWAAGAMAIHASTRDAKEGRKAFIAKRAPVWVT
ncbi:enoyl-CoA hydratase [Xylariaceae sp. FL1651]|nr:enoyl-CoA hydratase [Xylariaceae sp. FL1651]